MNREDVLKRIRELVVNVLEIESSPDEIGEKEMLKDYGLTSFSAIRLIVFIENEYGFEFADEDLVIENFETVAKLVDYVIAHVD